MGKDCLLLVKLVRGNYYKGGHRCFLGKKRLESVLEPRGPPVQGLSPFSCSMK